MKLRLALGLCLLALLCALSTRLIALADGEATASWIELAATPTGKSAYMPVVSKDFTPTPEPAHLLLLAGDICQHDPGGVDYTANCKKTGDRIRSVMAANTDVRVQTLGDNVNNSLAGSYDAEYRDLYTPAWGSFLNVTHSLVGNHDTYPPGGLAPYFSYFGAHSGGSPGYYSYNIGASWHVIVLNSQCSPAGDCSATSPQTTWLKNDLAANTRRCILAAWHNPRWTSGLHSDDPTSAAWWNLLYQYKADIIANAHNHNYERFHRINPNEQATTDGIREFVVGTGGAPGPGIPYSAFPLDPNEAVRSQEITYGVLQLTLKDSSYSWKFLPAEGYTFTDSGTTECH